LKIFSMVLSIPCCRFGVQRRIKMGLSISVTFSYNVIVKAAHFSIENCLYMLPKTSLGVR
jgi:hypothetical protein